MRTPNNITKHELIGLRARIVDARNESVVGMKGKIVDETQHTLLIKHKGEDKRLFKKCVKLEVALGDKEVVVEGNEIEGRPWDRIKK